MDRDNDREWPIACRRPIDIQHLGWGLGGIGQIKHFALDMRGVGNWNWFRHGTVHADWRCIHAAALLAKFLATFLRFRLVLRFF